MNVTRRARIAFGLALSLGVAAVQILYGPGPKATLDARLEGEAVWWAAVAVLLVYVVFGEKLTPSSAGLRRMDVRAWKAAIGAGLGIALVSVVIYLALFPVLVLSISLGHVSNILQMPWWFRALMVARIAVAQELMFRAYAIERIEELTGSKWIGAAVSLAVYIAVTWSNWGPVESIASAAGGAALTALYLWRRNAYVNMIASALAAGMGWLLH